MQNVRDCLFWLPGRNQLDPPGGAPGNYFQAAQALVRSVLGFYSHLLLWGGKKKQFQQFKPQTSPFSFDHNEPAHPEQEQPRACDSSDTQELLPTTCDGAWLLNQDPALP